MLNFFIWCMLSLSINSFASSYPELNCTLSVKSTKDFESDIIKYLDENSKKLILEYDLDFSHVGQDFDITNRTNPDAFQPLRWYRAQGKAVERLLMFKSILRSSFKWLPIVKNIKVDIMATPVGCLNNISREEMEPFIAKFLLDDFEINVEELRTSAKFFKNSEICTTHIELEDDNNTKIIYWCCWYDIHNQMACHSIDLDHVDNYILYVITIVLLFTTIFYLYSPMLFPKLSESRIIEFTPKQKLLSHLQIKYEGRGFRFIEILSVPKRFVLLLIRLCGIRALIRFALGEICDQVINENKPPTIDYRSTKAHGKRMHEVLATLNGDGNHTVQVKKVFLRENKSSFIKEDQTTINGLISLLLFFFSATSNSDGRPGASKWVKIILIFISLYTIPTVVSFLITKYEFQDPYQKDITKANITRILSNTDDINFDKLNNIFFITSLSLQFIFFILILRYEAKGCRFSKMLSKLPAKIKESWQSTFDKLKKCYKESFCSILFFPLVLVFEVLRSSPLCIIILSAFSKKFPNIIIVKCFLFYFLLLLINVLMLFILFPSIIFFQMFLLLIALLMFQANIIYPILSGLIAFLINLRLFSRAIGEKHDECLKKIIYLINKKTEGTSTCINTIEYNEPQDPSIEAVKIECKENCMYLTLIDLPAYVFENGVKSIKKTALLYCMRHLYLKALFGFLAIFVFMSAVVCVVFTLGRFDYINTSNQVFLTFVTGVIPSLLMLGKEVKDGRSKEASTTDQNSQSYEKELVEIENSLKFYTEKYPIDDMIIETETQQTTNKADYTVILKDTNINLRYRSNQQRYSNESFSSDELTDLL